MAWSTIRNATDADRKRMFEAAARFCTRHNIDTAAFESCESAIDFAIDAEERDRKDYSGRRKLATAWRRIVRRALDNKYAEGIAYGYVGYHVK